MHSSTTLLVLYDKGWLRRLIPRTPGVGTASKLEVLSANGFFGRLDVLLSSAEAGVT